MADTYAPNTSVSPLPPTLSVRFLESSMTALG
jgi:hypothetical protein